MKLFRLKTVLVFLGLMVAITAISFLAPAPKMQAGSWAEVCCGTCAMDYCRGSGEYSCCKPAY